MLWWFNPPLCGNSDNTMEIWMGINHIIWMSTSGLAIENIFRGLTHWLEEHEVLSNFNTCRMWIYWDRSSQKKGDLPGVSGNENVVWKTLEGSAGTKSWDNLTSMRMSKLLCKSKILILIIVGVINIINVLAGHYRKSRFRNPIILDCDEITIHHHASGVMRPGGLTPVTSRTSILRSQDLSHHGGFSWWFNGQSSDLSSISMWKIVFQRRLMVI